MYFYRFDRLGGEAYRLDRIRERVAGNYHRRQPFPEKERSAVREYREKNHPQFKGTGLAALYARYCFELHILKEHPASVREMSFFLREDLIHMDRLEKQMRLLAENGIETPEDLERFRGSLWEELAERTSKRQLLRNEQRRAETAGNGAWIGRLEKELSEIKSEIRTIRKKLRLCERIEERSETTERELKRLEELRRDDNGKEEKRDEHVLERGGGAGRPHDPGRQ